MIETTGCDSLAKPLTDIAASCGKMLEFVAVVNDNESVARYGKGFGEGYALDYAFDKSKLLQESEGFFKCTGKIIVPNYLSCVRQAKSKKFYFDAPRSLPGFVDTRFYFVSSKFWIDNLRNCYRSVDDPNGTFLEHVYFEAISRVDTIPFNPVVIQHVGTSGSSGESYTMGLRLYMSRVLLRKGYGIYKWLRMQLANRYRRKSA